MELFNNSSRFNGFVRTDESLALHTTMKVGGKASVFIEPADENSFIFVCSELIQRNLDFLLIGGGSNIIVSDDGFDIAVCTKRLSSVCLFSANDSDDSSLRMIRAQCGASWGTVIRFCKDNILSGFEEFTGLPGTVGGAVYMNASCFGKSTDRNLVSVRYFDTESLSVKEYIYNSDDWGYKKSPFQKKTSSDSIKIVLSAVFSCSKLPETESAELNERCSFFLKERTSKGHFSSPSAGSVFRNKPEEGITAGKIIDECSLKGVSVGGAKVAPWHGNFIINTGNASAADIKNLVELVRNTVRKKKGVSLECEIIFASDASEHPQ